MRIAERSYAGRVFRPRPEIHCDPSGSLCIVATPWGSRSVAKKVIQSILDFFMSARSDEEVTSPFATISSLSPMANNLRVAIMLANDNVFREENRAEFRSGVELFVASRHNHEVVWAQVGGPHVYLDRAGFDMQALSASPDAALQHSTQKEILAPLPSALLGLSDTSNFSLQSLCLQPEDKLILVHRSLIPPRMSALPNADRTIQNISSVLAQQSTDLPFWLGMIQFD